MILLILTIFLNIILIFLSINVKPLCLMYIFFLTYSVNLIPYYFFDGEVSSFYFDFNDKVYFDKALIMHFLFLIGSFLGTKKWKKKIIFRENITFIDNQLVFWTTLIVMIFIVLFGKTGNSILQSGSYGINKTSQLGGLAVHEYFIIFIPIAYIFGKGRMPLILLISSIYLFKTLLFGTRIEVMQVMAMMFIFFEKRETSWRRIFPLLGLGFVIFAFIGIFRSNPLAFIYGTGLTDFNFLSLFKAFDNQSDIFYSSARLIGMVDTYAISTVERIQSGLYALISIVVPYKFLPEVANLAAFKKEIYPAGGGGMISSYYFIYLSYLGPFIIGLVVSKLINSSIESKNNAFVVYGILVLSTYFRWFGYSPIVLFKLCFYGVILLKIMTTVAKVRIKRYIILVAEDR